MANNEPLSTVTPRMVGCTASLTFLSSMARQHGQPWEGMVGRGQDPNIALETPACNNAMQDNTTTQPHNHPQPKGALPGPEHWFAWHAHMRLQPSTA